MKIAVVGYGGVGAAFIKLLKDQKEYINKEGIKIQVNYILNSRGGVYNPHGIDCEDVVNSFEKDITFNTIIKNKDVDLVVEVTPTNKETGQPGMTHIAKALENGMHVVTANKGPILLNYKGLNELAVKNNVELCIGCTTGGALPSINGGIMDLAGSNILSIEGVLNGTTNFILNEMEANGVDYSQALKKAQELGIAETNPTLDVEGWDTASKLLILTNVLMNQEKTLKDMNVEGITKITPEEIKDCIGENKKYKLVGKTTNENGNVKMSVKLEKLSKDHPLYNVDGKNKGVRYTSDPLGDLTIIGGASGVTPAAASILRDLINIHRGYKFSR
ncbi:homoserine dehydrogenase [Lutibacter sp. B2]|nr:homoserine dehydrogenase [Lutibacter sp. B2]